jgi:multiple sugar transport system ATP-binding protein
MLLGIRPEDIEVAQLSKTGNTAARFPAIVDIVEPMGAETNLYLQTGAHTVVCRSQRAFEHRESGHRLQFELNVSKAHLFDPTTTSRIV